VSAVEDVLRAMVDEYHRGCKAYAQAEVPDSARRVFWRVRLGVLELYGSRLAAALGHAEPEWAAMRESSEQASVPLAYARAPLGALTGRPGPVRCSRCNLIVGACTCYEEILDSRRGGVVL
jgi:hypothetical protein